MSAKTDPQIRGTENDLVLPDEELLNSPCCIERDDFKTIQVLWI